MENDQGASQVGGLTQRESLGAFGRERSAHLAEEAFAKILVGILDGVARPGGLAGGASGDKGAGLLFLQPVNSR
jgi:hypothetical protein